MESYAAIAKRVKGLMEEKGMTYSQVAEKSGLPYKKVYRLANVGASNPGMFTMKALCDALDVTLDEFLNAEEFK